jgi:hypothetical protein
MRRHWVVLGIVGLCAIVSVALLINWYTTPAGLYNAGQFSDAWQGAANNVLNGKNPNPSSLPGFGKIEGVTVNTPADGARQVVFSSASKKDQLIYFVKPSDSSTRFDECLYQLSAHWWQVAPLNIDVSSCPRGFVYIPAA